MREAAEICAISVREMLDLLLEHGVKGNIQYDTQKRSFEIIEGLE